jgi:hypothetical protein
MAKKPTPVPDSSVEILPPTKRPVGRPSQYSEELADEICVRIAQGTSIKDIGAQDDMPSEWTIYHWRNTRPEFSQKIARAREDRDDVFGFELIQMGREVKGKDLSREQLDVLRFVAEQIDRGARLMKAKTPRVDVQTGATLVQNTYTKIDVSALDPDQRDQLKQVLLAARRASEGGA